jgi:hypothetical protein
MTEKSRQAGTIEITEAMVEAGVSALHDASPWLQHGSNWPEAVYAVLASSLRARGFEVLQREQETS